jgi:hypothetical protein
VSFYTTELPEYVLVEAFRGLGPADVHVSAALTYTLLVVGASLLAKGAASGSEGLVRVLIAAGIMIAPRVGPGAFLLLLSPDHTGTGVPLLAVFLLLDRAPRRWWVPVLTALLLAWMEVGDRIAITAGAAPIAVACGVRAYRDIVQRREPAREHWFDVAVAAAAVVSALVAAAAGRVLRDLGGFVVAPLNTMSAPSTDWPGHVALATEGVLGLYGADFTSLSLGAVTVIALVHLAGLALAAWAVGHAIGRFSGCDLITQVLTVAIVINLAVYALSVLPDSYWANREIAPVLPFGAVLAHQAAATRRQPGADRLAHRAPPHDRARQLCRGKQRHAGQPWRDTAGGTVVVPVRGLAGHPRGEGGRLRPATARRHLLRHDRARRPGVHDPDGADHPRVRRARAHVSLPRLDDHDLAQEFADRHPARLAEKIAGMEQRGAPGRVSVS